jgi:serine/threonine protein kinase
VEIGLVDPTRSLHDKMRTCSFEEAKTCVEIFKHSMETYPRWLLAVCRERGLSLEEEEEVVRPSPHPVLSSECLGIGSGGIVYKITSSRVVKLFTTFMDRPHGAMRERNVLLHMTHPHIVKGFCAYFNSNSIPCVELEFAPYGSIVNVSPYPDMIPWIAEQLWSAMSHLHSANLIHGDIRPLNVLVFGPRLVKICDFELCIRKEVVMDGTWFNFKVPVQSHAPESFRFSPPNNEEDCVKVDWWGVGMMLFGMLHSNWDALAYTTSEFNEFTQTNVAVNDEPSFQMNSEWNDAIGFLLRLRVENRCSERLERMLKFQEEGIEIDSLVETIPFYHELKDDETKVVFQRRRSVRASAFEGYAEPRSVIY